MEYLVKTASGVVAEVIENRMFCPKAGLMGVACKHRHVQIIHFIIYIITNCYRLLSILGVHMTSPKFKLRNYRFF